jgi:hypothetical protein
LLQDRPQEIAAIGVLIEHEHAQAVERRRRPRARCARRHGRHQFDGIQRKPRRELRPAAAGVVARADLTAMQLHQIPDEREADSESACRAGRPRVFLGEAIEDARQECRVDAGAAVRDSQDGFTLHLFHGHTNRTTDGGELHRVREQVPDDLPQAGRIAQHRHFSGRDSAGHVHALGLGRGSRRGNRLTRHVGE